MTLPVGQGVKTSRSQRENTGSNPVRVIKQTRKAPQAFYIKACGAFLFMQ